MGKLRIPGIGIVAVLLTGGIAVADIPDSGVIHGCRSTFNGALRVIDASTGGTCRSYESPLDWSQTGPTGPPGPPGVPGQSDVFVASHPATAPAWTITVSVPAGSYFVIGHATVVVPAGSLGQGGTCFLASSQGPAPGATTSVQGSGGSGSALPVQGTFTFSAPDTVSMTCQGDTTSAGQSGMGQGQLATMKVGAIH
jgi:hypothetical protein